MRTLLVGLLAAMLPGFPAALAGAADADAAALLDQTGIRGGLCLVAGARDAGLATALAARSALYVQALQPDAKAAAVWGAEVGGSTNRESVGIRNAAFDPAHYGSCLFNLVILADPRGAADAGVAPELARILVPGGVLALAGREAPPGLAKAGLQALPGPDGWVLLKKTPGPAGPVAPTDSLRWRAGSRWQRIMYHDFPSVRFGAGKLVYREAMAGTNGQFRFELMCRDAFNGRLLWKIEEELLSDKEWSGYLRDRMGLAIGENGRIYTGLGRDFVCLDAETGKVIEVLKAGGRPGDVRIHKNKHLLVDGRILDLAGLSELGAYRGGSIAVGDDIVYSSPNGRQIAAYRIPDGKELWNVDTQQDQPGGHPYRLFCSETALHVGRGWPAASLSTMDPATGKTLWTYPPEPRPKVRDVLAYPSGDRLYIAYDDGSVKEPHDFVFREVEAATGKTVRDGIYAPGRKWAGGCWGARQAGDYLIYHHNLWFNVKTATRTSRVLFRPKCDQGPLPANGLLYGFPAYNGMSAAGGRLFVSTRDGKLLCFEGR